MSKQLSTFLVSHAIDLAEEYINSDQKNARSELAALKERIADMEARLTEAERQRDDLRNDKMWLENEINLKIKRIDELLVESKQELKVICPDCEHEFIVEGFVCIGCELRNIPADSGKDGE